MAKSSIYKSSHLPKPACYLWLLSWEAFVILYLFKNVQKQTKLDIPLSFWTLSWLAMRLRTTIAISISSWESHQHPDEYSDEGITGSGANASELHQHWRLLFFCISSYLNNLFLLLFGKIKKIYFNNVAFYRWKLATWINSQQQVKCKQSVFKN